ncbi:MAG: GNAT family N-acetyltransferase, partial [Halobacillus sp.]|uniref:GNAT family N-acetyltransferase n=1 Tax=Halobacillus sp. TaxID=56800 RepID=UPI003BB099EE
MGSSSIKEIQSKEDILEVYPVMKQLRTHLDLSTYSQLVAEAQEKDGYKMFALYEGEEVVAVVGFEPMITLYYGRFVWVCDLVTEEKSRSNGYGKELLNFVHDWAIEHSYESVALSSGLQRT